MSLREKTPSVRDIRVVRVVSDHPTQHDVVRVVSDHPTQHDRIQAIRNITVKWRTVVKLAIPPQEALAGYC